MLRRYVLTDAQSAAELLREWDSKMNAAQKSALQDALQVTEQTYMTLEDAIAAARTIDIDGILAPFAHESKGGNGLLAVV